MNVRLALAAFLALALVGLALVYGTRTPTAPGPGPTGSPTPTASGSKPLTPAERAPAVVVFQRLAARKADLVLKVPGRKDLALGDLEVAANGHVMGKALIRIPTKARGIALRRVVLRVPDGLDPRVVQAAQTLLIRGGAGSTEVAPLTSD